jgi:hypothetical protein
MKPRSRTSDGRFARELPDGTIDAVALGTMATGLVLGAVDHLPVAQARTADSHLAPFTGTPLPAASGIPHAEAPAHDGPSVPTSTGATVSQALHNETTTTALPEPSRESLQTDAPPALHETLASVADTISSAMKTLVEQVQAGGPQSEALSSVLPHVSAMADSAAALAHDIAVTFAPPSFEAPSFSSLSTLPELPALHLELPALDQILGAATAPELPALDEVLGAATHAAAFDADLPASVLGAPEAAFDHLAAPIVESAPLQIGFLGQSYTESVDSHDASQHGMPSLLHGLV